MAVSYKKLWKLLIDRDMMKKDLAAAADISNYTISKMSKGENVTVEISAARSVKRLTVRLTISWNLLRIRRTDV